jgi:hypothetical protein
VGGSRLCLPDQQDCTLEVRLGLGDLRIEVPPGVAMRLRVNCGWLARARVSVPWLVAQAPGEWTTAGLLAEAEGAPVCQVVVHLGAGELTVTTV